jgi:adenosine kinase
LRAAEKFEQSHLSSPQVAPLIDAAKFFYVEGYFLTHGTAAALELSSKSSAAGKTFVLNLSAPFIPQFFGEQVNKIIPHTDVVIGNEAEAEAWATANGLSDPKDLAKVAKAIATLPKANTKPRTVVFTQGALSTVAVTSDKPDEPKWYPVTALTDDQIVDTNGAGDAFAGGFVGALVAGKSLDESVEAGHKLGSMCVQLVRGGVPYQIPIPYLPLMLGRPSV